MGNLPSRNHLPGKNDLTLTHKPLINDNSEKAVFHITSIPISSEFPEEGHVDFITRLPDIQNFEGLFSFTLYYNSSYEEFLASHYYCGLFIYAELIHHHPEFKSFGMVIYTDKRSQDHLQKAFSAYPKVIYGVTNWSSFAEGDAIEGTILRCMRFQAVEAFPQSIICTRDADTIFTTEIMTAEDAYRKGFKGKTPDGTVIDDYRPFLAQKIGDWEAEFIKFWKAEGSPINIGTNFNYHMRWHQELPFVYSIKNVSEKYGFRTPSFNGARLNISKEQGGRFSDYYNETKLRLVLNAPVGIYAGFTNFAAARPSDLWSRSFDYITSHYLLVDHEKRKIISNARVTFIDMVGKDERIVLFAMIPKYHKLCYFFCLEYYGSDWVYYLPGLYNPSNKYVKFTELLDFGKVKDFSSKFMNPSGNVSINTILLSPDYIKTIYESLYHPTDELEHEPRNHVDYVKQNRIRQKLEEDKKTGLPIERHTFNYYFQQKFDEFSTTYNSWISELMTIPEANMDERIKKIIRMQRIKGYRNDYRSLNESDFFVPVKRIHPRKSLVGGSKNARIRRKTRKSVK